MCMLALLEQDDLDLDDEFDGPEDFLPDLEALRLVESMCLTVLGPILASEALARRCWKAWWLASASAEAEESSLSDNSEDSADRLAVWVSRRG